LAIQPVGVLQADLPPLQALVEGPAAHRLLDRRVLEDAAHLDVQAAHAGPGQKLPPGAGVLVGHLHLLAVDRPVGVLQAGDERVALRRAAGQIGVEQRVLALLCGHLALHRR
jgi:hypothetical protein